MYDNERMLNALEKSVVELRKHIHLYGDNMDDNDLIALLSVIHELERLV